MRTGVKIRQLQFVSAKDAAPFHADVGTLFEITKVNLFVGPNNVGKSRLLRSMFSRAPFTYLPSRIDVAALNLLIEDFRRELRDTVGSAQLVDFARLIQSSGKLRQITMWSSDADALQGLTQLIDRAADASSRDAVQHGGALPLMTAGQLADRVQRLGRKYRKELQKLISDYEPASFVRVYIPALRGARVLTVGKDLYAERTVADYFPVVPDTLAPDASTVVTGQDLYGTFRSMALGDEEKRDAYAEFARILSNHFFREPVTIVPREREGTLHVRIGSGPDRPIHGLGDGLQHLMIMLFTLFFHRDRDLLLFIEEPELFLHPSLQRALLSVFASDRYPRAQIFASTHSNYLLDRTVAGKDVSCFLVMRDTATMDASRIVPMNTDGRSVLDALGAVQSSLFLTNCTIWVEGITDRMYLRKWLDLTAADDAANGPMLIEDVHYSFFEYAGSNLEHWQELASTDAWIDVRPISPRMMVIADADRGKDAKHQRMVERLGLHYVVTDGIEVENLLSDTIILKVVEEYEKNRDNLRRPPAGLRKETRIGNYIDEHVLWDAKQSRRYRAKAKRRRNGIPYVYAAASGTIADKVEFARRAVTAMTSPRTMTAEAKQLVKSVREFIRRSNEEVLGRGRSHLIS